MPKPNPNLLAANAAAGYPQPILYLPLSDPTQPGKNLGTGGDFTLNGVVARSGGGPSQFNAAYSDFDGAADYLSRATSLTGIADGKQFTFSCCFNTDDLSAGQICYFGDSTNRRFEILIENSGQITVIGVDTSGSANCLAVSTNAVLKLGRNYVLVMSVDLTNTSNRYITLNGENVTPTWYDYANTNIDFSISGAPRYRFGANGTPANYFNGRLGNLFFDTRFIDLSVPANLAKFVTGTGIDAKPVDLGANGELPFGTPPLIYLPMYGNNAGKNYGTGGDFTVISGPFTGVRGPNEFCRNWADFDGTTGYFSRTSALSGVSDGKTFSCSFFVRFDTLSDTRELFCLSDGNSPILRITSAGLGNPTIGVQNGGTSILNGAGSSRFSTNSDTHVCLCVDLSDVNKRYVFINGVLQSFTWSDYSNTNILLSNSTSNYLGRYFSGSFRLDGKLSEFYFTTEYIDFSQEANRLKFRDAFGNPVDLRPQIAAGTLPNPAIYMRFDPSNFGKNSGTGGDFVVNGTITDGGQL